MTRSRLLVLLVLTALVVAVAGCGDDDSGGDASTAPNAFSDKVTPESAFSAVKVKVRKVEPSAGEADPDTKPKVPKGEGAPPTELEAQDLIVGKGAPVKFGDTVSLQYVRVLFENGKEVGASWRGGKPGQPLQFAVGGGQLIRGLERGVAGMRKGGRRKLIIPAKLAYGAHGAPPKIPPNSAVIFVIDLDKRSKAKPYAP